MADRGPVVERPAVDEEIDRPAAAEVGGVRVRIDVGVGRLQVVRDLAGGARWKSIGRARASSSPTPVAGARTAR
jgi:hypothetical protein